MTPPETRYAKSGDIRIAYQVVGNGPFDLVFVLGFVSNLDLIWEDADWAHFFSRLASFSRLIVFDKRGTGLSDRDVGIATLEERMDDVRAVMDAAGSDRAALFGVSEGGPMSLLFAATYPQRVRALILYGTYSNSGHLASEDGFRKRIESIDQLSEQLFGQAWTPSLNSRTVCLFHPSPQIAYPAHRRPWCYRTVPTQTNPFHRDRQIRAHALPATRWGNNASAPSLTLNPAG